MQAQSRLLAASGSSSSSASAAADEAAAAAHEAVVRELARGRALTARLQAEALRALRGQEPAERAAAVILREVSRAFTVCLSVMGSPGARASVATLPAAAPPETPAAAAAAGPAARRRDDNIPRQQTITTSPHFDGYQWRKYGQKRITRMPFQRCYYRCSYHRERSCRATKQVQQCSHGDPPQYVVMYFHEHTCDTAAWEPEAAAAAAGAGTSNNPTTELDPARHAGALLGLGERGAREEHERLVSSLTVVLAQSYPAAASGGGSSAAAAAANSNNNVQPHQEPPPPAGASSVDAPGGELPRLGVAGLDVTDYDVAGGLYFGDSYGLADDNGLPF